MPEHKGSTVKRRREHSDDPFPEYPKIAMSLGIIYSQTPTIYKNLRRFLMFIKNHDGMTWDFIRIKARLPVGMGYGTLNEYYHSALANGLLKENGGHVYFIGLKKGIKIPEVGRPFTDYPPPPERKARPGENPEALKP